MREVKKEKRDVFNYEDAHNEEKILFHICLCMPQPNAVKLGIIECIQKFI